MTTKRAEPVLIGPVCVGKSSVAAHLSELCGVEHHDLDADVGVYYEQSPYFDAPTYNELATTRGPASAYEYSGETLVWALQHYLEDHQGGIFDIGAGYTSHRQAELNERVAETLSAFTNVILLLPSADAAQSLKTLRERISAARQQSWILDDFDYLQHWVTAPDYSRIATLTIYTEDNSPTDIANTIRTSLNLR